MGTRSDIYSLEVLLYELLTGTTPLDMNRMRGAALAAGLMAINEDEPPKPSTRLSESKDSLPSVAAQRQTEPAKLTKSVRGELDWMVMKALEKDRTRRYETASAMARDVERYLGDEPIEAGPPRATYRLRKFLRRNKGPVLAASVVVLALVAGAAVAAWQAIRARRAEQVATAEEQDTTTLPGAPQGEYVLIQMKTDFESKKGVIETVTPMLDKGGKWRVSGYQIK